MEPDNPVNTKLDCDPCHLSSEDILDELTASVNKAVELLRQESAAGDTRSNDEVLKELAAVQKLAESAATKLKQVPLAPQGRRKDSLEHLDFISSIHAAPAHTRSWLLQHFRQADDAACTDRTSEASSMTNQVSRSSSAKRGTSGYTQSKVAMSRADERVTELLTKAGQFDFDALDFAENEQVKGHCLCILGAELDRRRRIVESMCEAKMIADERQFHSLFMSFLGKLDMLYKPDALYHGSAHAADVMSTTAWFMNAPIMTDLCTPADYFMVLVAAAIHDVGHPGFNNLYLQNTMDSIAIRYNDRSCLEQMHLAIAFELMQKDAASNWFGALQSTGEQKMQQYIRKGLIGMVLGTDMAKHAEHVKNMNELVKHKDEQAAIGAEQKSFLLETVLHAADVSNPSKPYSCMLAWTKRVSLEFWAQGDAEASQGLAISPLCDRATGMKSVPQSQIGFIDFVVMPYLTLIVQIIPETQRVVDGLKDTKAFWEDEKAKGASFEDIFGGD